MKGPLRASAVLAFLAFLAGCAGPDSRVVDHGKDDTTILFDRGVAARDLWVKRNGCSATTSMGPLPGCTTYTGCRVNQPVVFCEHQYQHAPPNMQALQAMVDFFRSFR